MPGTANGDPESYLQVGGSLAGFETLEALLEVHILPDNSAGSCLSGIFCLLLVFDKVQLAECRITFHKTSLLRSSVCCMELTEGRLCKQCH